MTRRDFAREARDFARLARRPGVSRGDRVLFAQLAASYKAAARKDKAV